MGLAAPPPPAAELPLAPLLAQAIGRALDYLHEHQLPNGEFAGYLAPDKPMQEWCQPESSIFVTALVAECLLPARPDPRAEAMLAITSGFLQYQMGSGFTWGHYPRLHPWRKLCPADVDDTCCAAAVLRALGVEYVVHNVPLLLSNRTRRGLFYTWFLLRPRYNPRRAYWRLVLPELLRPVQSALFWAHVEANRGDVDAGVNANVLYYLGDRSETQPVIAWLLRVIADKQETTCDKWYHEAHVIYYFISRNYRAGITQLAPARQPIIDRIRAAAQPDGRLGDTVLDTATAVCALLNFGAAPPELPAAVRYLLQAQGRSGAWPRWVFYWHGPKEAHGQGSEELTTAFCLEALLRYQRHSAG